MVKYNKIDTNVIVQALDEIPLVRDGKGNIDALVSFCSDIRIHRKFMRSYVLADWKAEKIDLINKWNDYMKLRNFEDFIPHSDSKNKLVYISLF